MTTISGESKQSFPWHVRRAQERKEAILQAAARAFRDKGFEATTVEEIANELQYTKGNIYYYIPSKEHLLFECHQRAMSMVWKGLQPILESGLNPLEKLRLIIANHIRVLTDELSPATIVLQQKYYLTEEHREVISAKYAQYDDAITEVIHEGQSSGTFRPINAKLALYAILGACNWMPHWYSRQGPLSKEELADILADFLIQGLILSQPNPPGSI